MMNVTSTNLNEIIDEWISIADKEGKCCMGWSYNLPATEVSIHTHPLPSIARGSGYSSIADSYELLHDALTEIFEAGGVNPLSVPLLLDAMAQRGWLAKALVGVAQLPHHSPDHPFCVSFSDGAHIIIMCVGLRENYQLFVEEQQNE